MMMQQLVQLNQRYVDATTRKQEGDTDSRLRLEKKLVKLGSDDVDKFSDELEAFEEQMQETKVPDWKTWYKYFEKALEPEARDWLTSFTQRGQGKELREAAWNGRDDQNWWFLYRACRGELMRRAGAGFETTGDVAQHQWDTVRFPDNPNRAQIMTKLNQLQKARVAMVKSGRMDESEDSRRREMTDLRKKVTMGTQFAMFVYGRDFRIETYDQFVNTVLQYASLLPQQGKKEHVRAAYEQEPEDEWGSQVEDQPAQDEQDPFSEESLAAMETQLAEAVRVLGNFRLAAGGLAKKPKAAPKPTGPSAADLQNCPHCIRCKGRHRVSQCPNVLYQARATPAEREKFEKSGDKCTFVDSKFKVVCKGHHPLTYHVQTIAALRAKGAGAKAKAAPRAPGKAKARVAGEVDQDGGELHGPDGEELGASGDAAEVASESAQTPSVAADEGVDPSAVEPMVRVAPPGPPGLDDSDQEFDSDSRLAHLLVRDGMPFQYGAARAAREIRWEPARVAVAEEPLPVVSMGTGFNCVVGIRIGSERFRVVLDSGAARNLIRQKFADKLWKSPQTQKSCLRKEKGDREIRFEGILKGIETEPVSVLTTVMAEFEGEALHGSGGTSKAKPLPITFSELKDASDPMIIGFPTLASWGFGVETDEDGVTWVTLSSLGVRIPAEGNGPVD